MDKYSSFQPTVFDPRGKGLPDKQDWLIVPVSVTRDSEVLAQSNWDTAVKWLKAGKDPDVEIHRFGHWGPGWFEIIIVKPDSPAATVAEEIETILAQFPVLDELDYYARAEEEDYASRDCEEE